MTTAFDWSLMEYLAANDPIAQGLLVHDLDADRDIIETRLRVLRERGLATFDYTSRPTHWRLTPDGRACLAIDLDEAN